MSNNIKLIFGENGAGKSLYYQNKMLNPLYIALNYDVENWYKETKDKSGKIKKYIISQEKYLNSTNEEKIKFLKNKIYKNRDHFGKVQKKDFYNFLKKINFNDHSKWQEFSKNNKNQSNILDNNIELYISIWEHFDKYKSIIDSLTNECFELIKVYISFKFECIENLETTKAKSYQDAILKTQKIIYEEIKDIKDIDEILTISDIEILDKIKNNNLNVEELTKLIKLNIISCNEVNEIFKLMKQIEENKKICLNFNDYREKIQEYNALFNKDYQISEDGYSIENINLGHENYSNGQKIIHIFDILINCFANSNKTIILDDVFEKLDNQNSAKLINLLFDEFVKYNYNLEILTHDENFVDLFYKVLDNRNDIERKNIIDMKISFDKNKPNLKNVSLSLTFDRYIKNIYQGLLKENISNEEHKAHFLFAKYFNRRSGVNNIFQVLDFKNNTYNLDNNITHQIYEFLSENIFHYEENLKQKIENNPLLKQYFNDDILLNSKDTSSFYEKLIKKFEVLEEPKFGLSLSNVSKYLQEMLLHINEEKEYYENNKKRFLQMKEECKKQNKKFSKYHFYRAMKSRELNSENKTNRNKLFHNLEYSLTILNKTNL